MKDQTKQLKKNDFLAVVTEEPMSRDQLVEALAEYEYVPSYLDYLTDHFIAQGKVTQYEDGTISRKARKGSTAKNVFRVGFDENHAPMLESKENVGVLSAEDKEAGWSVTENAAIKKACQQVFADYKAVNAVIKALTVAEPETAEGDTESQEDDAE